jgi:hypothetical protein
MGDFGSELKADFDRFASAHQAKIFADVILYGGEMFGELDQLGNRFDCPDTRKGKVTQFSLQGAEGNQVPTSHITE